MPNQTPVSIKETGLLAVLMLPLGWFLLLLVLPLQAAEQRPYPRARLLGQGACRGCDLRRVALKEAHLIGADLRDADLEGADLRGANLEGADLSGARLVRADLRGATLTNADLTGTDLRGADLRSAVVINAFAPDVQTGGIRFAGANLTGSNLIIGGGD